MKQLRQLFSNDGRNGGSASGRSGFVRLLMLGLVAALMMMAVVAVSAASGKQSSAQDGFQIALDEYEPTVSVPYGEVSTVTGAPVALYQVNYAVDPGTPEEMAEQYLSENAGLLHLQHEDLSDLSHRVSRSGPSGDTVRFSQSLSGVPVYGAEIAVHINNDSRITFVTSLYKSTVTLDDVSPTLPAAEATRLAYDYLQPEGIFDTSETILVVYHNQDMNRLAYQVQVAANAPLGDWEVLVDANTGELFKVVNNAQDVEDEQDGPEVTMVDGTGNVFDPDPLTSATALYGDPGFSDNNDATSPQLDGERFNVTLNDIQFSGGMHTLIGPFAEIQDFESPLKGLFSQASSDFNYNRFDDAFEAANTYYHIDASMRYLNVTLGLTVMPYQYSGGVRFDPHGLNGADNSHYTGGRVAFGEGGVDDAEDSDVIHHELGHGLHDWFTSGGLSQVNGLSEGIGDFWAQSYNRSIDSWTPGDPQYNWVFRWDGHNPFWPGRVTNWPAHYPEGLTGQIHTDGQIWGTAMMKVWDAIGKTKTDTAHWEGISMTGGGTNQSQAANAVFQAAIDLGYPTSDLVAMHTIFSATGYTMAPLPIPDFALNATPSNLEVCVPDDAEYEVGIQSLLGFTGPVTLSLSGEPAGATVNFSPNGASTPYTSTLTIGNLSAGSVGSYSLEISGMSPTATHTTTVGLDVADVPGVITLLDPADGELGVSTTPVLDWQSESTADTYTVEIATDPGFSNIVDGASGLSNSKYTVSTPLGAGTIYYWRVSGDNVCGAGSYSPVWRFTTIGGVYLPLVLK